MLRVLVVEDEDMIRKGFIHTIDWIAMGCLVIDEACNGEEGLEKIQKLNPDIVITDIIMPKMNGIEMIEKAKEIYTFRSIILTSYSEFEYAQKAINLQVCEYLLKPVDEEMLFEVIQKLKKEIQEKRAYNEIIERTKDKKAIDLIDIDIYIQSNTQYNYYVIEAINQIKENYNKKVSIELIAETLNVSASYLSRKFKEETSQTFLEVLNKYRIQKAIEFLHTGNYRVYEVSDLTGFSEYKHFCNVFKKYTQNSPTEFIRNSSFIIYKG
ncbi:response regulator transcription factor [Cellulosilyticum sp. I15G10I2]|uniref:response regulator transcription factor n=1 Tax=Cellulosilyticum sp. I15G10I2 TaxID=1892843 RepID=UPI00085C5458|nr:response regulator [Cellulosilyticum sp. I15G10I2]